MHTDTIDYLADRAGSRVALCCLGVNWWYYARKNAEIKC